MQLWVTVSTQDVPTELLEGSFAVKWIDCFRAVCVCVSKSVLCKQDLLLPSNHGRQSPPMCMRLHSFFFHGLLGMVSCHGNW